MSLKISKRARTLALHDLLVFLSTFGVQVASINGHLGRDTLIAAAAAAAKIVVRKVVPVPALETVAKDAPTVGAVVDSLVPAAKSVVATAETAVAAVSAPDVASP